MATTSRRSEERGAVPAHGAAVLLGALLLLWPAMLNGYALLNPDSLGYLAYGPRILGALLHPVTHVPFEARAEFYCIVLNVLHGRLDPWPILVLQALVLSYVLWLVVRSFAWSLTATWFLATVATLSMATGLSWQVSWVMTDILGPAAYLCMYLLVFAWEDLAAAERCVIAGIAWWCITAHLSHGLLGGLVFVVLLVLRVCGWRAIHSYGLAVVFGVLLAAAGSLMGLHGFLYGRPSLDGFHPPYLLARVIADGPGRVWLQEHCPQANLVVCSRANTLPATSEEILWLPDSIWLQSTPSQRAAISQQEKGFVLAAIQEYPFMEAQQAMRNFAGQAVNFGFHMFVTSPWLEANLETVTPGSRAVYMRGLQARNAMPVRLATRAQQLSLLLSCVVIVRLGRDAVRGRGRLLGLTVMTFLIVVANAFVCGALSTIDDRYQNRVIWLIPLLAFALLTDYYTAPRHGNERAM